MQIALDDFGVGSSNFELIYELEPEYIKLDKFFISTLESVQGKNLIRGMLHLTEKSSSTIIVEGVETDRQKELLLDLGVRFMQGFHFGLPLRLTEFKDVGTR